MACGFSAGSTRPAVCATTQRHICFSDRIYESFLAHPRSVLDSGDFSGEPFALQVHGRNWSRRRGLLNRSMRRLIGYVLLDAVTPIRPESVITAFRARHPHVSIGLAASADAGKGVAMTVQCDGEPIIVMSMPMPLPKEEWKRPSLRASVQWPEAPSVFARHGAHLVVATLAEPSDRLKAARCMAGVIGALIAAVPGCRGVFWESLVAHSAAAWLEASRDAFAPYPAFPYPLWVSLHVHRDGGWVGVITFGLSSFVGREIELEPQDADVAQALHRAAELAVYLMQHGAVLNDGDTFGATAAERIRVRHVMSKRVLGLAVLHATGVREPIKAKVRKRFFEISPSWAGAFTVGLGTEGEGALLPLTSAICFAGLETLYGHPTPSSAQFGFHKRPNAIPDMVHATGDVPIVTAAFKTVVERLAPGEAEFRPFAMRWPDDEPVAGEWYLMNVLNIVDCFDFERMGKKRPPVPTQWVSGGAMTPLETWLQTRIDQHPQSRPVYIDPRSVGALQIWRPLFRSHSLYCTSEILKALKAAGVRRLHAERLGTRDDPTPMIDWDAMGTPLQFKERQHP